MSDVNGLELKTCKGCGVPQPLESFPFDNKKENRRATKCKLCKAAYDIKNREKIYERQRQWRLTNPDKVRAGSQRAFKKRGRKIQDYQNQYWRDRSKNDPSWKLRRNISCCIKEAMKRNDSQKNGSILQHLPYSFQELKAHLEKQFEPWMNWNNHGRYNSTNWDNNDTSTWTWQIDHIIPQADLPYTSMTDDNFQKCWALPNLRPYSAKQNQTDGGTRVRHTIKR